MADMFAALAADMAKREAARERERQEDREIDIALMKSIQSTQDVFFRQVSRDINKLIEKMDELIAASKDSRLGE